MNLNENFIFVGFNRSLTMSLAILLNERKKDNDKKGTGEVILSFSLHSLGYYDGRSDKRGDSLLKNKILFS